MGVVPGALAEVAVGVDQPEPLAAVVGAEQAALLGLDQGPDPVGVGRRDGDADAALDPLGQPLGQLLPAVAAVLGAPQAAVLAAAVEGPRLALHLPDGGVEDARVGGVHGQVDGAGAVADVEHLLPARAAVARAEDAALLVGAEDVAEGGDVDHVGIRRVDADAADLAGLAQADVAPAVAGVGRAVDADPRRDVAARAGRAGAGVDHVGVRGRHRHGADRAGLELLVGDVGPAQAAVGGLPDAAAGRAHVEQLALAGHAGDRGDPAAAVGADVAEPEPFELLLVEGRRGARLRRGRGSGRPQQKGRERGGEQNGTVRHLHGRQPPVGMFGSDAARAEVYPAIELSFRARL